MHLHFLSIILALILFFLTLTYLTYLTAVVKMSEQVHISVC